MKSFVVAIPTLNGGEYFKQLLSSIHTQQQRPIHVIVVDSGSVDGTLEYAQEFGCRIIHIPKAQFNHGTTRQMIVDHSEGIDVIVYLTQDAVLAADSTLGTMMGCFVQGEVGAAYGRQLPHNGSGMIGAHARLFNYPPVSRIKAIKDVAELGIKTAFISNSFAAYHRNRLLEVGGFPHNVILGEDTYVAAKMILAGRSIAYCADAQVYHSHDYTWIEEFQRYFDIGIFHARESWIRESLGQTEGEGLRFVKSEFLYLWEHNKSTILWSVVHTLGKIIGYKLGLAERFLPHKLKSKLSMHKGYWR